MKIYGRVQGVGFRFSAERKMSELGIVGWVRNCDDGCVETEVKGDEDGVEKYRKWCAKGPIFAQVTKVEEKWVDDPQNYDKLDIMSDKISNF